MDRLFSSMTSFRLLVLACLMGACISANAKRLPPPPPIYLNLEPIEPPTRPPQIDALTFENRSLFVVQDSAFLLSNPTFFLLAGGGNALYQGQSVLDWKNSGTMIGVPGFRFETLPDVRRLTVAQRRKKGANLPKPARSFINEGDISVNAQLFIHSTNIISPGRLEGDLGSRITLWATNGSADLSRGAIRIGRVSSPFFLAPGIFFNFDPDLLTLYSATGTNGVYNRTNGPPLFLPTAFPFFGFGQPTVAPYQVIQNPALSGLPVTFRITNSLFNVPTCGSGYSAFAQVTNSIFGFGKTVTIAFVETNSFIETNISVRVRFLNSFVGTRPTVAVEYQSTEFDIIDQEIQTNVITFLDTGSILPMPLPTNVFSVFPTPSNYQLVRNRVAGFETASPGNTSYSPSLLYNTNFQNDTDHYAYSSVAWQLGPTNLLLFNNSSLISPFFTGIFGFAGLGLAPAATDPTNFPSRVEISAKNLSLDRTRIRAEQAIDIRASNLQSNKLALLDAPFINFEAGTTNVNLILSNLAPAIVNRTHGQLSAYSATWTETVTNEVTGLPELVQFHVLIVGNCLQFSQPTILHRLSLQATNLVLQDNFFVNSGLKINSEALTIGSGATLQLPLRSSWAFTNVQNVSHLTNSGLINVSGAGAFFGTAPSGYVFPSVPRRLRKKFVSPLQPYEEFVNHGIVVAATVSINASLVENTGAAFSPAWLLATNGPVLITGRSIIVNNGILSAGQDIEIRGDDVSLRNSLFGAGTTNFFVDRQVILPGALIIDATNSLGDSGVTFTNRITVTDGVRILRRPAIAGDFLGSAVISQGGVFREATFTWAGEDRGATVEGFSDNLALGRLTLDGSIGNLFHFSGAGVSNAIYVDYLELLNDARNFNFALGIDPDFTVYFADSNEAPEHLELDSGGRLRWVNQFIGPNSSTNIVYPNGATYTFNAGLVRSKDLDSDGDGTVNGLDCTPISVPDYDSTLPCAPAPTFARASALSGQDIALSIALGAGSRDVILNWDAAPHSANTVEFTDSLTGGTWQTLTNFINGPVNARVTVQDAAGAPLRVYRVRVDAGNP